MTLRLSILAEPQHFSLLEKLLFAAAGPRLCLLASGVASASSSTRSSNRRRTRASPLPHRQARLGLLLGGSLPGQGHPRAPAPRPGPRLRLLGLLRLRAGHAQPLRPAFGIGFLSPAGAIGRFYFYFAAVFALACAVGILGLFIRRFLVRPKWLGEKLSWESGFIALLIFALMATYLASFFVADTARLPASCGGFTRWRCSSFCPSSPTPSTCTCVLSPATVFLSRGSFAQIPPLGGDEDFGLVAGTDLTQLVSLQAYSCVECGRCTEHCPAANTGKLLNPKEIILGVRAYLNDLGPASDQPLLGKYNSQEAVFQCTTCGACEFQCPVGIEHVPILVGLRRGAVNTGEWENDYGAKLFLALERGSNALGISPRRARQVYPEGRHCPSSTEPRSIASGWAAWADTTPRAARSSPTSPAS